MIGVKYDTQWRIPLSVQIYFNFMQFSGIYGQIIGWHPSLWGSRPSIWEVLDPPPPGTCISVCGPTPNCYIYHIWRVHFHHKWRSVASGTPRWSGCDVRTSCCRDTQRTARNGSLHTCRMKMASTLSETRKWIVLIINTFCEVEPGAGSTLKFFEPPPPPQHTHTSTDQNSWDFMGLWEIFDKTRMHSSRIRTTRSLPYGGPPDRTPWKETPQTETPSWTGTPLDRDPLNRDPGGQRPSGQGAPGQRPPPKSDRKWHHTERDIPPCGQTERGGALYYGEPWILEKHTSFFPIKRHFGK